MDKKGDLTWFILIILIILVGIVISNTLSIHTDTINVTDETVGKLVASQIYQFNDVNGLKTMQISSDGKKLYFFAFDKVYSTNIESFQYLTSLDQNVSKLSNVQFVNAEVNKLYSPIIETKVGKLTFKSSTNVISMDGNDIPAIVWSSIKGITETIIPTATYNATSSKISFGQTDATSPPGKFSVRSGSAGTYPIWSATDDFAIFESSSKAAYMHIFSPVDTFNGTFPGIFFSFPGDKSSGGILYKYYGTGSGNQIMDLKVGGQTKISIDNTHTTINTTIWANSYSGQGNGFILQQGNTTFATLKQSGGGATPGVSFIVDGTPKKITFLGVGSTLTDFNVNATNSLFSGDVTVTRLRVGAGSLLDYMTNGTYASTASNVTGIVGSVFLQYVRMGNSISVTIPTLTFTGDGTNPLNLTLYSDLSTFSTQYTCSGIYISAGDAVARTFATVNGTVLSIYRDNGTAQPFLNSAYTIQRGTITYTRT